MALNIEKLSEIATSIEDEVRQSNIARKKNQEWIRMSREIALTIHYYLRKNGMSQKELAEKLGVSPAYVGKLVKGKENLTLETISKVQEAIGCDLISIPRPYEYNGKAITYCAALPPVRFPELRLTAWRSSCEDARQQAFQPYASTAVLQ